MLSRLSELHHCVGANINDGERRRQANLIKVFHTVYSQILLNDQLSLYANTFQIHHFLKNILN